MAREQYIFETNTINGGFLVDRRTNQIVGTTANGVDQYFVTGDRNPVTGGMEFSNSAALASLTTKNKTIAGFGDSFIRRGYAWFVPWTLTKSGSVMGISSIQGLERSAGAGTFNLVYTAATRSVSWNGGPSTVLVDGFQIIPGPTASSGVGVGVNTFYLPGTDGSIAITRAGTRPDELLGGSNVLVWINRLSQQSYKIKNYAHGSGQLTSAATVARRASNFDFAVVNYGTNDISAGRTLVQMQDDTLAFLAVIYPKCLNAIFFEIPVLQSGFTLAQKEQAHQYNVWLRALFRSTFNNYVTVASWERFSDDTGGAIRALMSTDSIHPSDVAVQLAAMDCVSYINNAIAPIPFGFNLTAGNYSAANKYGNRFANTFPAGNVAGAPTNWSAPSLGTGVTSTPTKVARIDGVAGDWARLTSSGTTDNQAATYNPAAGGAAYVASSTPAGGESVQAFVEVAVSGAQMQPTLRIEARTAAATAAFSLARGDNFLAATGLIIPSWSGIICTAPFVWDSSWDGYSLWIQQYLHNGASAAVLDIGRVFFGYSPDLYSTEC